MNIKIVDFTDSLYVETNQNPDEFTLHFNGEIWQAHTWRAVYDNFGEGTYYCHYVRERDKAS